MSRPVLARDLGHAALELVIARLAAGGKSSRPSRMVTHPERVGARDQRRVHRARVWKEVGVRDIEVVDVVRFTVDVGRGALGSMPKRRVPQLWATPASGDLLAEHRPAQDRLLIAAQAAQESGELRQGGWKPAAGAGRANQPALARSA